MMAGILFFASLFHGFLVGALGTGVVVGLLFACTVGILVWVVSDITTKG